MPTPSPQNRVSRWEWAQAALLAINLAWTTLCLGGYRPETMVVTTALTGLLVAIHFLSRALRPAPRTHPAGWLFVPFLVYAAINAAWLTPVHWLGWRDWIGWAQMIAVFWVVLNGVRSPAPRRALFFALVMIAAVASVLACYQHFVDPTWMMLHRVQADQFLSRASGSFGIPNSFAALLMLLLPALGVLTLRPGATLASRFAWGGVGALLVVAFVFTISRGAWLGLALSLGLWPLIASKGTWKRRVMATTAVLVSVVLAGAALYFTSVSVRDRMIGFVRDRGEVTRPLLWRAAWRMFREHLATGSGAGSFNVRFEQFRTEGFLNEPQWAHNDYLNTLSDYGAIGFGLFFGAAALTVWWCRRCRPKTGASAENGLESPAIRGALGIGLLAFALQLFVDFHFKIPALAMAFATVSALLVQQTWLNAEGERVPASVVRLGNLFAAAAAGALAIVFVGPHFRAEALRLRAREAIDQTAGKQLDPEAYRASLRTIRDGLVRAVLIDPSNAQAWADTAYADALWANITPAELSVLGQKSESAANRALALAPDVAEFWVRHGVALDMRGQWFDASLDFSKATLLAPNTSWIWFYQADHLSRKATERGLAEAALALCLRLDPANPDGLALRQRLAISQKAKP